MTTIGEIYRYQNQAAFAMLDAKPFDPNSIEKANGVVIELTDTDDDVVMMAGDDNVVNAKNGNNTVFLSGNNSQITAADGNNMLISIGDNGSIKVGDGNNFIQAEGDNNTVTTGNGDNIGRIYGDKNTFTAGTGANQIGFMGDYNNIISAGKNSLVGFWGDYNNIKVGSNSYIGTLDHAVLAYDSFADIEERWVQSLGYNFTSAKVNSKLFYDYTTCTNLLYCGLSPEHQEIAETVDLTEKKNGKPKYVIVGNCDGTSTLYTYSYTYEGHSYYYPVGKEGQQKYKKCINSTKLEDVAYDRYDDYTMVYSKNFEVDGVTGNSYEYADGNNSFEVTRQGGVQEAPNMGKGTHHIKQDTYYEVGQLTADNFTRYDRLERKFYTIK